MKKLNPHIHISARAGKIEEMKVLHNLGVSLVIHPEFESSLEFARQALLPLVIPTDQIERYPGGVTAMNSTGRSILPAKGAWSRAS